VNDIDETLTCARFEQLLDQLGADLARWPEPERAAAIALLGADARARELLAQAEALETGLRGLPAPEPSAALRRAIAEIPLRHPQPAATDAAFAWLPLRSALSLFATAALMVALGGISGALATDLDLSLRTTAQVESGAGAGDRDDAASDGYDADADDDALAELVALTELAFADELDKELLP
jgi:hypothetical protein